ncbi:related to amine oxidase, flavin-containing superfamily [Lecanosticta acicola]|uniref:Related to amine oxidase, flavin-containing superfamily n=1 Tax=Lecanosticta acicola TaxID=111012 RepID=A0AAI8Z9E2_9PEZI|nr:related to amine oxidase, flavin-containing superfamily [Lecanosticta acicola]
MASLWSICKLLFALLHLASALSFRPATDSQTHHPQPEIIERDVAIIGGGSSGTYSAIRLQQQGHSVALIEKENRLGGHVNTFVDPPTGGTFDYGVIILVNVSIVRDYFQYLDTPLGKYTGFVPGMNTLYADFAAGASAPAPNDTLAEADAVPRYARLLQDQYPYLASGFHIPKPVPEELLIPYGDFLAQRNLSALAYTAWYIDEGVGNALAQPALYMLKYYNLLQVEGINYGFVNAGNNYQGLYDTALRKLGNATNAFLNSCIDRITRSTRGVEVQFTTPTGRKIVRAKKLVMTIPPLLSSLKPFFDLTPTETSLFGQYNSSYIWDAIVNNTGIPGTVEVQNRDPEAPDGIPALPAAYAFVPSPVGGVHATWYSSPHYLSDEQVKTDILQSVAQIQKAQKYSSAATPEIVEFHSHNPYELTVSLDAIKEGFYDKVNALQGQLNTYWTGAAWESHDSTAIWNFTEYEILPKLIQSLH